MLLQSVKLLLRLIDLSEYLLFQYFEVGALEVIPEGPESIRCDFLLIADGIHNADNESLLSKILILHLIAVDEADVSKCP